MNVKINFFLQFKMEHAMTIWKSYKTIRKSKSLMTCHKLFKIKMKPGVGGARLCLCETTLLLPGSQVESMVPRIYLLAVGELFIFKLKTHHYLGKDYLTNIWNENNTGNKAAFVKEHLKGSCRAVVFNWPWTSVLSPAWD